MPWEAQKHGLLYFPKQKHSYACNGDITFASKQGSDIEEQGQLQSQNDSISWLFTVFAQVKNISWLGFLGWGRGGCGVFSLLST